MPSRALVAVVTALAVTLLIMSPLPETDASVRRLDPAPRAAPARSTSHLVVALGDSVPSGAACGCRPFPALYGSLLRARTGVPVTVRNFGVDGLTTSGLLAQLRQRSVAATVRRADVVLVTIGANDVADHQSEVVAGDCKLDTPSACVSDELRAMRTNLRSILTTVRELRRGAPTTALVSGYWNVFEDGDVARRISGSAGLLASITLTRAVNAAIRSDSAVAGASYVDLFTPFQSHGRGITSLLASDGNHPDAIGHRLIATTLLDAGLPRASWH